MLINFFLLFEQQKTVKKKFFINFIYFFKCNIIKIYLTKSFVTKYLWSTFKI